MAREARKISSAGMYAVKLSGKKLFKADDDEKMFLELLEKYFEGGAVYGYALSDNEIKLVVKETPKGISMTMKPLITSYARYYNRTHNTEGKLFSGRFLSEPIESEEERKEAVKNLKTLFETKKTRDTKPTKPKEAAIPEKKPAKKKSMPSYLL